MKRGIGLIILLIVFSAPQAVFSNHIPVTELGVEFRGRTAFLPDYGIVDPFVELEGRLQGSPQQFRYGALTMGSYFRVLKNLKVGVFWKLQQGVRHDDDWIASGADWIWRDTRGRFEHLLMLDVTPRFLLPFLPGENWVVSLKGRYIFNAFNLHHSIYLRPGLTFFLIRNRNPLLNVSLNYGVYFPLNFSESFIYEHEPYLTLLFHLTSRIKIETTAAFRTVMWSTSREVLESGEGGYLIPDQSFVIGAGILFMF